MSNEVIQLAADAASHGPHPAFIGIGAFVILMSLLGITLLFSGNNQRPSANAKSVAEVEREHGRRH